MENEIEKMVDTLQEEVKGLIIILLLAELLKGLYT